MIEPTQNTGEMYAKSDQPLPTVESRGAPPDAEAIWWNDLDAGGAVVIYPPGKFVPQSLHLRVDDELYVFVTAPGEYPTPLYVRALALADGFSYAWDFETEPWMEAALSEFGIRLADDTTTQGITEALMIETEAFPADVYERSPHPDPALEPRGDLEW